MLIEKTDKEKERYLLMGISLGILFLIGIHKLTNASLWYDETIEFYYSKFLFGLVPDGLSHTNIYERIVSTFQPPLYNVVMFFWLNISQSEWWFRFFGVVMGVMGGLGIFKAVEKVWDYRAASVAVLITACTKQYVYYMQECAEYTILLASLGWLVYAWLCLVENPAKKQIITYIAVACIAIYSQYGAAFPVIGYSVLAFLMVAQSKNKEAINRLMVGYGCALLFAGLPLYIFFLRKQMEHSAIAVPHAFTLTQSIIKDIYGALKTVVGWNLIYNAKGWLIVMALMIILVFVFTKLNAVRGLILANVVTWGLYYVLVKLSYYSYGDFGNRYNLFFIPIWIPSLACILHEFGDILKRAFPRSFKRALFNGVLLAFAFSICMINWDVIKQNWKKEDIRGAVEKWCEEEGYNKTTLVYYAANSGFHYYVSEQFKYGDSAYDNVKVMQWFRGRTKKEYEEYFTKLFSGNWPKELYFVISHNQADMFTMLECFSEKGYTQVDKYSANGGRLIFLSK